MSELTSLSIDSEERTDGQQKTLELDDTALNVDRTTPDYSEATNDERAKSGLLTETCRRWSRGSVACSSARSPPSRMAGPLLEVSRC